MSKSGFGQVAADLHVALGDVPADRVRGKVLCGRGHRMALLTRHPDTLYTGQEPILLSDSRTGVIGVCGARSLGARTKACGRST